ncbi:MAG: hypothetical protein U0X92_10120 [Anaerolineales bacterium]
MVSCSPSSITPYPTYDPFAPVTQARRYAGRFQAKGHSTDQNPIGLTPTTRSDLGKDSDAQLKFIIWHADSRLAASLPAAFLTH